MKAKAIRSHKPARIGHYYSMGGLWTSIKRAAAFWTRIWIDAVKETVTDVWSSPLKFALFAAALVGAVVVWQFFRQPLPTYTLVGAATLAGFVILAILWKVISIPARRAEVSAQKIADEAARSQANALSNATGQYPDWPVKSLFFHIRPDVLEHPGQEGIANWNKVEGLFLDAASLGRLQVWGRLFNDTGMNGILRGANAGVLQPIPAEYWRQATLTHQFYGDRAPTDAAHTSPGLQIDASVYCDLQVNRSQAESVWAGPDPNAKIQFEIDLAGTGVAKVHMQSMIGVRDVVVDKDNLSRVNVYFHQPLQFQYIVSAEGNQQVFLSVESMRPDSVTLIIRGASVAVFLAVVRVKIQSTRFTR